MSARRRTHLKFHEKKVAGMVPLKALLLNSSILHHQNTCNGLQFGAFQYQFNTIRDTMGDKLKQCAYVGSSQAQPHCWQKPVHHLRKLRQRHQALRQRAGHVVCVKRQRPAAKRNGIARRLGRVSPPKAHDKLSSSRQETRRQPCLAGVCRKGSVWFVLSAHNPKWNAQGPLLEAL